MIRACVLAATFMAVCVAQADSGRLRFSKTAGPFLVTLFTSPEPLTAGPADMSVMVQDTVSGRVLSDADIRLHLTGPAGQTIYAYARQGLAANRLLQSAQPVFSAAGVWHLSIELKENARAVSLDGGEFFVEKESRRAKLAWIFSLLPLVAIALFIANQSQKEKLKLRPRSAN